MRFIGSKNSLLGEIDRVISLHAEENDRIFCDLFAGTGSVGKYFKTKYRVIANDILYFSYILTAATVENNTTPLFPCLAECGISDPVGYLENEPLPAKGGYITETYSPAGSARRMYLTEENARRIDFIRETIAAWKRDEKITDREYSYLLASLIEAIPSVSNITGTYGAYLKQWDPRTSKPVKLITPTVYDNGEKNICYNEDANTLIRRLRGDILYIDPPYNDRQYLSNYHLLETVAKNDCPTVSGVTGVRPYTGEKSEYCSRAKVKEAFAALFRDAAFRHIVVSYSNDGLLSVEELADVLQESCVPGTVEIHKVAYRRYAGKIKKDHDELYECLIYGRKDLPPTGENRENAKKNLPKNGYLKSPLNYVGGKFRLLPQLLPLFPESADTFIDLFAGSCTVAANMKASHILACDMNDRVMDMMRLFRDSDTDALISRIHSRIDEYGLSDSNEEGFRAFRDKYNASPDPLDLFTLSCFSFNYQIRFNNNGLYNNPFGRNRSRYSPTTEKNLIRFCEALKMRDMTFYGGDFTSVDLTEFGSGDFLYCDPPYLITNGSYNDGNRGFTDWTAEKENALLALLDDADKRGIRFALSNVFRHKGQENGNLMTWARQYNIHPIDSSYSHCSYHRHPTESETCEVLITNY